MNAIVDLLLLWLGVFLPWTLEVTLWSAAVLLLLRMGRRWSPHTRAAVAHVGAVKMLIAPALLTRLGLGEPLFSAVSVSAPWAAQPSATGLGAGWAAMPFSAVLVATLGTVWMVVLLAREAWRLARLRQGAEPWGADTKARTGRLTILVSDEAEAPFAMGILRPAVVLPRRLIGHLSAEELEALIAHEAAHLRSGDLVWTWIGAGLTALFWFHPLVRRIVRQGSAERELRCDDRVLAGWRVDVRTYSRALVAAASAALDAPGRGRSGLTTSALGHGLEARLRRILAPTTVHRARLGFARLAVLAILGGPLLLITVTASGRDAPTSLSDASDEATTNVVFLHLPVGDHQAHHRRQHRPGHRHR